jgi:hypothetical protein
MFYTLIYEVKILNTQFVTHTILVVVEFLCSPALPVLMSIEAMQHRNEDEIVVGFQLGHD